jgi:hypothetical protein
MLLVCTTFPSFNGLDFEDFDANAIGTTEAVTVTADICTQATSGNGTASATASGTGTASSGTSSAPAKSTANAASWMKSVNALGAAAGLVAAGMIAL